MKNLTLLILFLSFAACKNAPKNEVRSENTEIKDPSVFEQKNTNLAVETMPDLVVKPFLRKPPKAIHPVFGLFYPPIVRDLPDTIKPEIGIVKSVEETPISTNLLEEFAPQSQFFTFDMPVEPNEEPSDEIVLTGKEGTKLTIGRNVFETENGKNTEGSLRFELKEFYKMEDIIAANLTTQSDGELLETGGMIYISATDSKGQKLRIKSGKSINIEMQRLPNSTNKQLFYGEKRADSTINWRLAPVVQGEFGRGAYKTVEQNPEYPDGQKAMFSFLGDKIRYPKIAYDNGVEGTVIVGFVVSEYGEITDTRVLRGVNFLLNKEALRVVNLMPLWKAGRHKGKTVKTVFKLPIKFKVDGAFVATASDSSQFQKELTEIKALRTDQLRLQPMQEIETQIFETQQLGWINCDRLVVNSKPKTPVKLVCNSQYTQVKIVFKNTKSVLNGKADAKNSMTIKNMPIGEPVFFIVTYADAFETKAAIIDTVIENNQVLTPDLQLITPKEFLEKLKILNFSGK